MDLTQPSQFLDYYHKVRQRTLRVVYLINEGNQDFRLHDKAFSMGDIARHIVLVELNFYQKCLQNLDHAYKGCGKELAPTPTDIVKLYAEASQQMEYTLNDQPEDYLLQRCNIPTGTVTRWKWLRVQLEHEIHHRGQLYTLLGATGITTPPIFGMTSEELLV